MRTATITLTVDRTNMLTSNQRLHRMVQARRTRELRLAAGLAARAAGAPRFDRAHVAVAVTWPDARRRDVMNLTPTIKVCIDGFTDAGLWVDDDDTHLVGPDLRVTAGRSGTPGVIGLTFDITEISEESDR